MRLIDADKLIEHLKDTYNHEKDVINSYWLLNTLIDKVDEVPTDYDVDKVVEQLSDRSTLSRPVGWSKSYELVTLKDAIEIVKQGGKEQQWNRNTVPKCDVGKCSDEVLVTVEHIGCDGEIHRRVVKAVYFPYHHCTIEDMAWYMDDGIPSDWEYSEEDDSYWIPQGWYEVCDYSEDGYSYSGITDRVTAWMKLPKPYEPGVKELGGWRK